MTMQRAYAKFFSDPWKDAPMAKRVVTTTHMTDDLDGTVAERTVSFAYDGQNYELELSKKNIRALEKLLEPYVSNARRVKGATAAKPAPARRRGAASSERAQQREELQQIRDWAAANGIEVAPRGRIARNVVEAYQAAHAA